MARTRTLLLLRSDIRAVADAEGPSMVNRHPDSLLNRWINQSIQAFRLMVSSTGHPYYLSESVSANTADGTAEYALPADFVQMYGVDLTIESGRVITLNEFSLQERNDYESRVSSDAKGVPVMYRIHSTGNVRFLPTPDRAYAYKFLYLPTGTDLSSDSDTFDGVAGWEDWVIYDVALKLLARDDNDEQGPKIAQLLAKREAEIKQQAPKRSRSGPGRRINVRARRRETEALARSVYWRH